MCLCFDIPHVEIQPENRHVLRTCLWHRHIAITCRKIKGKSTGSESGVSQQHITSRVNRGVVGRVGNDQGWLHYL